MTNEMKIACYREAYAMLQGISGLSNFAWPEEKKNLDFNCIAGNTTIYFRLMSEGDLLVLRAECQNGGQDDKNEHIMNQIIAQFPGMMGTAYDGQIIVNMNVPFPSVADSDAKKLVLDKTKEFVEIVIDQLADLSKTPVPKVEEAAGSEKHSDIAEPKHDMEPTEVVPETSNNSEERTEHQPGETEPAHSATDFDFAAIMPEVMGSVIPPKKQEKEEVRGSKKLDMFNDTSSTAIPSDPQIPDPLVQAERQPFYHPDVEAERREMYEEMENTFTAQRKQLQCREHLLEAQRLVIEQQQSEVQSAKDEIEEKKKEVDTSSKKLKKNWSNYNSAKKNLDSRISELEEKEQSLGEREAVIIEKERTLTEREKESETRDRALQYREGSVAKRENDLLDKSSQLDRKQAELEDREATLGLQVKRISMQSEQLQIEKTSIETQIKDLKELQKIVNTIDLPALPHNTEEQKMLEEENESLKQQLNDLSGRYTNSENTVRILRMNLEDTKSELARVSKEAETAAAAAGTGVIDSEEYRALQEKQKQAEAQLTNMAKQLEEKAAALSDTKQALTESEQKLQQEISKCANLEKELSATKVYEPADKILTAAGLHVEPIAGEGDPLLSLKSGGCTVFINDRLHMMCIEKPVKRNHTKTFDVWNSQSFAETYAMSKGKAYCRAVFADSELIPDMKRIVMRLEELK